MRINMLLREGMEMLLYTTMGMGMRMGIRHGNGIEKVIPAHLYVKQFAAFVHCNQSALGLLNCN